LAHWKATALLRTVMEEIDVAIFSFDNENKLRLVNRAGERLLARPVERLLGLRLPNLAWALLSKATPVRTMELTFLAVGALGNAARIVSAKRACRITWCAKRFEPRVARRRAAGLARLIA